MIKVVIRLGLIALLVWAGVSLWYGRVEKKMEGPPPAQEKQDGVRSAPKTEGAVPPAPDVNSILTRNIFKTGLEPVALTGSRPGSRGDEAGTEDLAETRMQLELLGTVTGSREDARAIIRDKASKLEEIYRVGSELNGASIVRINRGKVVLRVNGREEVLNIKAPDAGGAGQRGRTAAAPVSREFSGEPESGRAMEITRPVPEATPRRRISFRNPQPAPVPTPQEAEPPAPAQEQPAQAEPETAGNPEPQIQTQPVEAGDRDQPGGGAGENEPPQVQ